MKFPASFSFTDKRLKGHTIRTSQVPDKDICELLCYQEPNCVSINFKYEVRSVAGGSYNCELNNSTHLGHDQDFVDAKGYVYRGAEVSNYEVPLQRNKGMSAVISMPFANYKIGIRIIIRKLAAWPNGPHTRLMKTKSVIYPRQSFIATMLVGLSKCLRQIIFKSNITVLRIPTGRSQTS